MAACRGFMFSSYGKDRSESHVGSAPLVMVVTKPAYFLRFCLRG